MENNLTKTDQLLDDLCQSGPADRDALGRRQTPILRAPENNAVNHPRHYNTGMFEVIDVIEDWELGFNLGNAVKYIARADHKGKPIEDLEKAVWYLQRELARRVSQKIQYNLDVSKDT